MRRRSQDKADDFSKNIILRLTASPATNIKSLVKDIRRKLRKAGDIEGEVVEVPLQTTTPSTGPEIIVEDEDDDTTGVKADDVPLSDSNLAGPLLDVASRVADFHERFRK